jgi:hypothetical protein
MVGSGVVHHAARDSCVGTASSCCSKGYPSFRVPIMWFVIYRDYDLHFTLATDLP